MKPIRSSDNIRIQVIKLVYSGVILLLLFELIFFIVDCLTGNLDGSVQEYFIKDVFPSFIWNPLMLFLLTRIDSSSHFSEEQKTKLIVFIITKICASIAISHSYYLPTQCVFVIAIITASLISDTKCIIFTMFDSVAMLFTAVLLYKTFSPTWPFYIIFESAIVSSCLLLFTGIMANFIVRYNQKMNAKMQKYAVDLRKATYNAKLDAMTGLYHHAEFYNILHMLISKKDTTLSVAIMDIDNFKAINDTFGHDNGDKVILSIAKCIKPINDDKNVFVARYGGEEFAFIFVNVPRNKVVDKLQEIRQTISNFKFDFDIDKSITMSCGMFECCTCAYSIEDVFNNADSALYYAKEHGKNRLVVYNEMV